MHKRPSVVRDSLQSLNGLQAELDADIRDESERPSPDTMRLRKLKGMRSRVQEQIEVLSADHRSTDRPQSPEAA